MGSGYAVEQYGLLQFCDPTTSSATSSKLAGRGAQPVCADSGLLAACPIALPNARLHRWLDEAADWLSLRSPAPLCISLDNVTMYRVCMPLKTDALRIIHALPTVEAPKAECLIQLNCTVMPFLSICTDASALLCC